MPPSNCTWFVGDPGPLQAIEQAMLGAAGRDDEKRQKCWQNAGEGGGAHGRSDKRDAEQICCERATNQGTATCFLTAGDEMK